ncbi:nitrite/sulfite reductase [Cellulosilyticum ruminicola]|uniref:nitrite/sulfite reductase n=1 Tax=Cellulosilyticum ruminicola TaxID=425254 RepID=UPI0006D20FD6|nr:nitrite/sulfite reductase [Cellulosilyticum ruminicola]
MRHSEIPAVIQSVANYKETVGRVLAGEEELLKVKSIMGGMGVYQQRVKGTFMLRVRIPSGVLKVEWFKSIYEIGKKVNVPRFHLTSRQAIQYHGLTLEQTVEVMEALLAQGLVTTGGGGDNPRNIACSPLSGVEQGEVFDVTPYALGCADYIMSIIDTFNLPRKYKIGFSNTDEDTANATATDLGFLAKIENGQPAFRVYVGGGIGKNPKSGIILRETIFEDEILYIVQGLKELFEDLGNRTNRNIARIRFIVDRLGEEEFKKTLEEYIAKVKLRGSLTLNPVEVTHDKVGKVTNFTHRRLTAQKQEGLYAVSVQPLGGYLSVDEVGQILEAVSKAPGAKLRLTKEQSMYITDLNGEEAENFISATEDIVVKGIAERILVCTGSNTCQIGLTPTEEVLHGIVERFKDVPKEEYALLPHINLSGCMSACVIPQLSKVGLFGGKKRVGDEARNAYAVCINGHRSGHGTSLGEVAGLILLEEVPEFLYQLGRDLTAGTVTIEKEALLEKYQSFFV